MDIKETDYSEILVTYGGAFRFTWNEKEWDMSNVDIYHTLTEGGEETVYSYAAKALGREFSMLGRTENTTKEEFIAFIKKHIDEGHPCIAQGIIGPPEACIMTGRVDGPYRKGVAGYDAWAKMLSEDSAFSGESESLLFEKMLCQDDATTCLIDGRGGAAEYFKRLAEKTVREQACEYIKQIKLLEERCLGSLKELSE